MNEKKNRICPVELAGHLDSRFRRWFQDPGKIVGPFVHRGMTVVDVGCGPGFFTIEMARRVGSTGRVIAVDLQEGMLRKLSEKLHGSELEGRVSLLKSGAHGMGLTDRADFVLAFYVVHEIENKERFFKEIAGALKENGALLIVEPPFHVSKKDFEKTVQAAREAGLRVVDRPGVLFSKTALLKRF